MSNYIVSYLLIICKFISFVKRKCCEIGRKTFTLFVTNIVEEYKTDSFLICVIHSSKRYHEVLFRNCISSDPEFAGGFGRSDAGS